MITRLDVDRSVSPEVRRLVTAAAIEETITASQWQRLEALLRESKAAREYYVEELSFTAAICFALRRYRDKETAEELAEIPHFSLPLPAHSDVTPFTPIAPGCQTDVSGK